MPSAPDGRIARAIDDAITRSGLVISRRGSLKKYPECLHWHIRNGGESGILELTFWPAQHRAWFTVRRGRTADWIDEAIQRLRYVLRIAWSWMLPDTTHPARSARELLDAAMICGMRWRYGYQGHKDIEKAVKALGRRCRGFTKAQKTAALLRGRALYDAAATRAEQIPHQRPHEWSRAVTDLRDEHPGFSLSTYEQALHWAHYWIFR